jgi:hypothetical protein
MYEVLIKLLLWYADYHRKSQNMCREHTEIDMRYVLISITYVEPLNSNIRLHILESSTCSLGTIFRISKTSDMILHVILKTHPNGVEHCPDRSIDQLQIDRMKLCINQTKSTIRGTQTIIFVHYGGNEQRASKCIRKFGWEWSKSASNGLVLPRVWAGRLDMNKARWEKTGHQPVLKRICTTKSILMLSR